MAIKVKKDGENYTVIDTESGEEIGGIPCEEIERADYEEMHSRYGTKAEEPAEAEKAEEVVAVEEIEEEKEEDTESSAPPRKKAEPKKEEPAKKKSLWWGTRL